MADPAKYSAIAPLRNGRNTQIRALRADDRANFMAAVERTSDASLYRRFFGAKRHFSEQEIDHYLDVDFIAHVALVAILEEDGQPVIAGGARYVVSGPSKAEVAFVVADQYQGQGIGAALLHHLIIVARQAGLKQLIAEVLPENAAMLKVFYQSGLQVTTKREPRVVHIIMQLS